MFTAMIVMILIDLVLFWAPVVGPIVAGLVGGWIAGAPGTAMMAAILPAIIAGIVLFLAFTYFHLPAIGGFLGLGITIYLLVTRILMIIAAAIGGALAR